MKFCKGLRVDFCNTSKVGQLLSQSRNNHRMNPRKTLFSLSYNQFDRTRTLAPLNNNRETAALVANFRSLVRRILKASTLNSFLLVKNGRTSLFTKSYDIDDCYGYGFCGMIMSKNQTITTRLKHNFQASKNNRNNLHSFQRLTTKLKNKMLRKTTLRVVFLRA